jgi:hypothetical protein
MKARFVLMMLAITLTLASCGDYKPEATAEEKPAPAAAPATAEKHFAITEFGPHETKAGQGFNIQPDGISALWFNTENATLSTVVVINETVLPTAVGPDGKLVTAGVPKALFAKSGELPIYLLNQKTGEKSNAVKFIVK